MINIFRLTLIALICAIPSNANCVSNKSSPLLPDQQLVKKIYEELKLVIGDKRVNWPSIDIWSVKYKVATYDAEKNSIHIDQLAIDVCRSMSEDFESAIAFIIGHELTHFYQAHKWGESGFASQFLVSAEDFDRHQNHEKQADIYGGFLSYQAGYDVFSIVPNLLEALYTAYDLDPNRDEEYPTLAKRKKLANNALALGGNLIDIYRAANYLTVLGAYDEAYQLYDYVSKSLRFKELFNNMGVCSLFQFFKLKPTDLTYPLDISNSIPISRSEIYRSAFQLLEDAQQFLQLAYDYDARYVDAMLHLLVAYDQASKKQEADNLMSLLFILKLTAEQKAKLHIISGNMYANRSLKEQAITSYETAIAMRVKQSLTLMAKSNLRFLKKGRPIKKSFAASPVQTGNPVTDGINLLTFKQFSEEIDIRPGCTFASAELPASLISAIRFNKKTYRFHWVYDSTVQMHGIGIGSTVDDLSHKMRANSLEFIGNQEGQFILDQTNGLIFKVSKESIVEEWARFVR